MNKSFLTVVFILFSSFCYAQETEIEELENSRTIGLSATIQGGQFDLVLPIWLSKKFVLAPIVGIVHASTIGTDLSFGLMPKIYFREEKIAPFINARVGVVSNFPVGSEQTRLDIIGGMGFGAEYFFDKRFSLGVEAQGNFTKSGSNSNRFGNPGNVNFNTATALIASIYF